MRFFQVSFKEMRNKNTVKFLLPGYSDSKHCMNSTQMLTSSPYLLPVLNLPYMMVVRTISRCFYHSLLHLKYISSESFKMAFISTHNFLAEKGLKSFKILKVIVYYIVVSLGFVKLATN